MSDDPQTDDHPRETAGIITLVQLALQTPQPSETAEAEAHALALAQFEELDSLAPRALRPQSSRVGEGIWTRIRRFWRGG